MASVLAIVSKALFEAARGPAGRRPELGEVWSTDRYVSANKGLSPLADGGDLYLVTVRPNDVLWLVGILRAPRHDGTQWTSPPNTTAIRDLTAAIPGLRFANGKGLQVKAGALGMSLQTPRPLVPSDVTLLGGGAATAAPAPAVALAAPPAAKPQPPGKAAKASPTKEATAKVDGEPPPGAAEALVEVITAWRERPYPALVAAAVAWSELAESPAARALRAGDKAVRDEAWDEVADAGRVADRGALCATFHRGSLDSLVARADVIAAWDPDPRVAHLLHGLLRTPPFRSTSSQPVWNRLFDCVTRHPDPATLAVVRDVGRSDFPSGESFRKYMANKLAVAAKKLASAESVVDPDPLPPFARAPGAAAPPPAAALTARVVPPPALPRGASVREAHRFGGQACVELRVSPSGTWAAAYVRDPAEREYRSTTAALAALDPADPDCLALTPLDAKSPRVFAVGHAPGTFAGVVGSSVVVWTRGSVRTYPLPPTDAEPAEPGDVDDASDDDQDEAVRPVRALAFGTADRELLVVATDQRDRNASVDVWWTVSLASGVFREVARNRSSYRGSRNTGRMETATFAGDVATVFDGSILWRRDRAWGAWSQVFRVEGVAACRLRDDRLHVDNGKGIVRVLDVTTGQALDEVGAPIEADPPAASLPQGELVSMGLRVDLRTPSGVRAFDWTASHVARLAVGGPTIALVSGSLLSQRGDGPERTHSEDARVQSLAVSPDGQTAYLGLAKSIRAVLTKGKPRTLSAHAFPVTALTVAPDGTLISGGQDHLLVVWDVPKFTVRHRIGGHPGPVVGLAADPAGQRVASVSDDGVVRVHDLASGAAVGEHGGGRAAGPVAYGADGVHLAWATTNGVAWEGGDVALPSAPTALASHPTRLAYAVATADGTVFVVLADGRHRSVAKDLRPAPTALAFTPDGDLVVGSCPAPHRGAACTLTLDWEDR